MKTISADFSRDGFLFAFDFCSEQKTYVLPAVFFGLQRIPVFLPALPDRLCGNWSASYGKAHLRPKQLTLIGAQ